MSADIPRPKLNWRPGSWMNTYKAGDGWVINVDGCGDMPVSLSRHRKRVYECDTFKEAADIAEMLDELGMPVVVMGGAE